MIRTVASGALGVLLGAAAGWATRPASSDADLPTPARPAAQEVLRSLARCTTSPDAQELREALATLAEVDAEVARTEAQIVSIIGAEIPWSAVRPEMRPDAVRAAVEDLPPEVALIDLDCETYPCVVSVEVLEGDSCSDELELPIENRGLSTCGTAGEREVMAWTVVDADLVDADRRVQSRLHLAWERVK